MADIDYLWALPVFYHCLSDFAWLFSCFLTSVSCKCVCVASQSSLMIRMDDFFCSSVFSGAARCSTMKMSKCRKDISDRMHNISQTMKNNSSTSSGGYRHPRFVLEEKRRRDRQQFASTNWSDEYGAYDEAKLNRHLSMRLDLDARGSYSMACWEAHVKAFPLVTSLIRRLHSIRATMVSVVRSFHEVGRSVTEEQSAIFPHLTWITCFSFQQYCDMVIFFD